MGIFSNGGSETQRARDVSGGVGMVWVWVEKLFILVSLEMSTSACPGEEAGVNGFHHLYIDQTSAYFS